MRIFIFIFSFFVFLFSVDNFRYYVSGDGFYHFYNPKPSYGSADADAKAYGNDSYHLVVNGYVYLSHEGGNLANYDTDCLSNHSSSVKVYRLWDNSYQSAGGYWFIWDSDADFCDKTLHSDYTYSKSSDAWLAPGKTPICPNNYIWSSTDEQCVFDCNSVADQASSQCGGSQFVKSYSCSQDGTYSITCYTCQEIFDLVNQLCSSNDLQVKDGLTCNSVNGGSVSTNFPFPPSKEDVCIVPAPEVNNTNPDSASIDSNNTDSNNTDSNVTNNNVTNIDSNVTNNNVTNINTQDILNQLQSTQDQLHSDNQDMLTSLDDLKNQLQNSQDQLHSDNRDMLTSLDDLKNQLQNSQGQLHSDLQSLQNTNSNGFSQLHSDLQDINSSLGVLSRVSSLTDDNASGIISSIRSSLDSGINKYSDYNFVSSDDNLNICLSDVSFNLFGKTITLKVSQFADSIYVKLVKSLLWFSAMLLVFFNCFRTD